MAASNAPSDLDFLISCIRNGEIQIDFTKVNSEYGWTNRSKSQIKYKNILKAHGLAITGQERYTKPTVSLDNEGDDDNDGDSPAEPAPKKRKTAGKPAAAKKGSKKAKIDDTAIEETATTADAAASEKNESVGKAKGKEKAVAVQAEDMQDEEA